MGDGLDIAAHEARTLRLLLITQRANLWYKWTVQRVMRGRRRGRTMWRSWLTSPWPPTGPQ